MIKIVILDFDGVILESVSVKTDAFRELFSFSPEHVDAIVQFHRNNGGMSRFDKFRYIFSNILKKPLSIEEMNTLSVMFSRLVLEKVISAPYVPGAEDFLKNFSRKMNLYIVSATPQEELELIIEKREMGHYFKEVFGSPEKKENHIKRILTDTMADYCSVIFVGDSLNDWMAARETGVRFIARVTHDSGTVFAGIPEIEYIVSDLYQLSKYFDGDS